MNLHPLSCCEALLQRSPLQNTRFAASSDSAPGGASTCASARRPGADPATRGALLLQPCGRRI
eukprot:6668230-Pyramimonas_sp.AAC.1